MRTTLKSNRSRIVILVICLVLFIFYKFVFTSEETYVVLEPKDDSLVVKKSKVEIEEQEARTVTVSVYYECLCPDSRSFFLHHLLPSYAKAPHLIDLEFIPYGKAKTVVDGGQYKFSCQHGPVECYGNKIHACSAVKVKDQMVLLKLLSCMIDDNLNPEERGHQCCREHNVDWNPILDCARNVEGDILLKEHGDATDLLQPSVSFIPTILLNQSQRDLPAILKNLWKEICRLLPETSKPAECLS